MLPVGRARNHRSLRARRLGGLIALGGRFSGLLIVAPLFVVTEGSPEYNNLYLAISIYVLLTSLIASLIESHALSALGSERAGPADVRHASLRFAAALALFAVLSCSLLAACGVLDAQLAGLTVGLAALLPLTGGAAARVAVDGASGHWGRPGLLMLLRSGTTAASVWPLFNAYQEPGAVAAYLLGDLARFVAAEHFAESSGPVSRARSRAFAKGLWMHLPGSSLTAVKPVVDRFVVAFVVTASVAAYDLADKFVMLAAFTLTQGVLPVLYASAVRGTEEEVCSAFRRIRRRLGAWSLLCVPAAAAAAVVASFLLRPLSTEGVTEDFLITALILSLGIPAYVIGQVQTRLLLVLQCYQRLNVLSALIIVGNTGGVFLLGHAYGLLGVAATTVLIYWLHLALTGVVLARVRNVS